MEEYKRNEKTRRGKESREGDDDVSVNGRQEKRKEKYE